MREQQIKAERASLLKTKQQQQNKTYKCLGHMTYSFMDLKCHFKKGKKAFAPERLRHFLRDGELRGPEAVLSP